MAFDLFLYLSHMSPSSRTISVDVSIYILFLFAFISSVITIAIFNLVYVRRRIRRTRKDLLKSFDDDKAVLSRELHDVVGSFLVPLKSETENMKEEKKVRWDARINTFKKFIKQTSHTIYPEYIYKNDLYTALNDLSDFISTESTMVQIHLTNEFGLKGERGNHSFKIILELLTNIIKHDKPKQVVLVGMKKGGGLIFTFNYTSKDSKAPDIGSKERSMGLRIINQRLIFLKAYISRDYDKESNQIKLTIPIK